MPASERLALSSERVEGPLSRFPHGPGASSPHACSPWLGLYSFASKSPEGASLTAGDS